MALVFAALAIRIARPDWMQWYNPLALSGLACTLLYMLSQWREIARSFSGRQARLGSLAVASVAVVLAILVAINYLASRHNKRWDLTAAKQFSLSDQTKKVLQGLTKPVRVLVFDRADGFPRFRERLDEYEYVSKQLKVEYIDVDKRPSMANQYNITAPGTVVFDYDGRTERVTSDGEQELTNGLIKVVQGKQHKVYFVQGHGEHSTDSSDRSGYSTIGAALGSDNFLPARLVLAQEKQVPEDASVLVVAGPKTDFFPGEIDMLKAYLAKGGKVLLHARPAGSGGRSRAHQPRRAAQGLVHRDRHDRRRRRAAACGGTAASAPTRRAPVAAKYGSHRDHADRLTQGLDGLPARRRSVVGVERARTAGRAEPGR